MRVFGLLLFASLALSGCRIFSAEARCSLDDPANETCPPDLACVEDDVAGDGFGVCIVSDCELRCATEISEPPRGCGAVNVAADAEAGPTTLTVAGFACPLAEGCGCHVPVGETVAIDLDLEPGQRIDAVTLCDRFPCEVEVPPLPVELNLTLRPVEIVTAYNIDGPGDETALAAAKAATDDETAHAFIRGSDGAELDDGRGAPNGFAIFEAALVHLTLRNANPLMYGVLVGSDASPLAAVAHPDGALIAFQSESFLNYCSGQISPADGQRAIVVARLGGASSSGCRSDDASAAFRDVAARNLAPSAIVPDGDGFSLVYQAVGNATPFVFTDLGVSLIGDIGLARYEADLAPSGGGRFGGDRATYTVDDARLVDGGLVVGGSAQGKLGINASQDTVGTQGFLKGFNGDPLNDNGLSAVLVSGTSRVAALAVETDRLLALGEFAGAPLVVGQTSLAGSTDDGVFLARFPGDPFTTEPELVQLSDGVGDRAVDLEVGGGRLFALVQSSGARIGSTSFPARDRTSAFVLELDPVSLQVLWVDVLGGAGDVRPIAISADDAGVWGIVESKAARGTMARPHLGTAANDDDTAVVLVRYE